MCLHGIVLIVNRRCRAGEVIDFVHLDIQREGHIVPDKLKARVADKVRNIPFRPREEIVDADDVVTVSEKPVAKVGTEKTSPARDEDCFARSHV